MRMPYGVVSTDLNLWERKFKDENPARALSLTYDLPGEHCVVTLLREATPASFGLRC